MRWDVKLAVEFLPEFHDLSPVVQDELATLSRVLAHLGPELGRPCVDTLKGSKHCNMKELRFRADGGVWRVAFAFDWDRRAILLVAGSKSGISASRFYNTMIRLADARFDRHLADLKQEKT